MCKSKWRCNGMRGYTLAAVNEALGDTKEIHSILDPRLEEKRLVDEIFEGEEEQLYSTNLVTRSWEKSLIENKKIFWEELYKQDISSRSSNAPQLKHQKRQRDPGTLSLHDVRDQVMREVETMVSKLESKLETKIITRLSNLETEVRSVRTEVSTLKSMRTKVKTENEYASDSFGRGGDENTKEGEDEVWADTSVTEVLADTSVTEVLVLDSSPHAGLDGTVADSHGIKSSEEVMPGASDQDFITSRDKLFYDIFGEL